MKQIKIGLIGLGRAGWGMHTKELASRGDKFKYVAACDLLPERLQRMQEKYPDCKIYRDYKELLADKEVELVCIATRSIDHFVHARDALLAGKDVLAEKPMAITYEQALELKAISDTGKCGKLYVRHNRRFEDNFLYAMETVRSGLLGKVFRVELTVDNFQRRCDWQTISEFGGGQLLNWGPHVVDHSLRLLGAPVTGFRSELKQIAAAGDCEDHLELEFCAANERTVHMVISGGTAIPEPEYRIYGDRGALIIANNRARLKYIDPAQVLPPIEADPSTPGAQSFGSTNTFASQEAIRWLEKEEEIAQHPLEQTWDYLYDAIANGKEYPITLEEAVEVIKYLDLAKRGSKFDRR